jgi:hypothetical protein
MRALEPAAAECDGRTRVIVPVIWNPVRLFSAGEKPGPLIDLVSQRYLINDMSFISIAALLAIGKSASLSQRLRVAVTSLFFILLCVTVPWIILIAAIVRLVLWHPVNWFVTVIAGIVVYTAVIASFARKYDATLLHLGSIWFYVGAPIHTIAVSQDRLLAYLDKIAQRAPRANIILVGCGLGGVLAAEALGRASGSALHDRVALLTISTPLSLITQWFPKRLASAQTLAVSAATAGGLSTWINLRRDGLCTRRASPTDAQTILDVPLRYLYLRGVYRRGEVWRRIRELAIALESGSLAVLREHWSHIELAPEERHELDVVEGGLFGIRGVVRRMLIADLALLGATTLVGSPLAFKCLIAFTICIAVVLQAVASYALSFRSSYERERLGIIRAVLVPMSMIYIIQQFLTAFVVPSLFWPVLGHWPYVIVALCAIFAVLWLTFVMVSQLR